MALPRISWKSFPADGATVGGPIPWEVGVADFVDDAYVVEFRIDANPNVPESLKPVWVERYAPFKVNGDSVGVFDTTKLANGKHKFGNVVRRLSDAKNVSNQARYLTVKNDEPPPPPPPPPPSGQWLWNFPAKFTVWGGREPEFVKTCQFVVCSDVVAIDANLARQTNPTLFVATHITLDPNHDDYRLRRGTAVTYGQGFQGGSKDGGPVLPPWPGVNDTLQPSPQGAIRGYDRSRDAGCPDLSGGLSHRWNSADSADMLSKSLFYGAKISKLREKGINGLWSDNFNFGNVLTAGWAYGECGKSIIAADWDAHLIAFCKLIREQLGLWVGGNVAYRASNPAARASTNMGLRETIYDYTQPGTGLAAQGTDRLWQDIMEVEAWRAAPTPDGKPKVMAVNANVPQSDTRMADYCQGMALIYRAAGNCYTDDHAKVFWRDWVNDKIGKPVSGPMRNGDVLSVKYEGALVSVNNATRAVTIARV